MEYSEGLYGREQAAAFANDMLGYAMTIGEQMLRSGAEISRVEDTIQRICRAYGAERVEVLAITSSIIVTICAKSYGAVTQTRRIHGSAYNLTKLELLNQLSRDICANPTDLSVIEERLAAIDQTPQYSLKTMLFIYALISGSFAMLFGGTWQDAIASAIIGLGLKPLQIVLGRLGANAFLSAVICSIFGGIFAGMSVRIGFAQHTDLIAIGNIMLLIPGVALTNSIRDMFSGDTISGLLRFTEALLLAVTIAFGFALSARWF